MREVGLGHTALDDQQDDWRHAVMLGNGLGLRWRGGERAERARAREARWRVWLAQGVRLRARLRRRGVLDGGVGAGEQRRRQGLGLGHGETNRRQRLYEGPKRDREGNGEKRPEAARDPLTGRSGGSDRTLPPSVRSIPERSNSSGIGTGRVRWSMTGRRQGPVRSACSSFDRPDAGSPPDRTHRRSVRSLLW